jgi:hypothetical protein
LQGASIAVALQRFFGGMMDFSVAIHFLDGKASDILRFAGRAFLPFWVPAMGLVAMNQMHPLASSDVHSAIFAALQTVAAMASFAALAYALDRQVITEAYALFGKILLKRRASTT